MKGMNNIKRPILVIVIGYILGILMGLYFKYSIVLLYFLITIIYYLCKRHKSINNQKRKFKLISFKRYFRYVKLLFSQKVILLIIISSVISNTMFIIKNTNFEELYIKEQGLTIKGIVVSDKTEKEYSDIYKTIEVNSILILVALFTTIISIIVLSILLVTNNLDNVASISQIRVLMSSSIGFLIGESDKK